MAESEGRVEERKYYVQCSGNSNHQGNAWRYGKEGRPDRCSYCGGPVDARLIEVDGERVTEDPDEMAIELERQGNEISERAELEAEERYAGPEDDGDGPYARSASPDDDLDGRDDFADPGGTSALRVATKSNPRNLPCPTCKTPNRLTPADRAKGYQCDRCADRDERGGF